MEKVKIIQQRLKNAQSRQKSYTNVRRIDLEFEIMKKVGNISYELELPPELDIVHLVFNISMFKKCLGVPSLIVSTKSSEVKESFTYEEIPVQILYCLIRKLRTKEVTSAKVLWRNQFVEEATWEAEEDIKARYPNLFIPSNNDDDVFEFLFYILTLSEFPSWPSFKDE
ncbi:uncharacterized protein LOC129894690 [Solanum dulcamara]|uniref:uncharacterized protein LOC129894690 n=1 Tax=Solanum dulcamara TaxID=45834 RepID=UPI002486BD7A|nr:uncharacterized protein LOC129894690 [Solanum dulcamara]